MGRWSPVLERCEIVSPCSLFFPIIPSCQYNLVRRITKIHFNVSISFFILEWNEKERVKFESRSMKKEAYQGTLSIIVWWLIGAHTSKQDKHQSVKQEKKKTVKWKTKKVNTLFTDLAFLSCSALLSCSYYPINELHIYLSIYVWEAKTYPEKRVEKYWDRARKAVWHEYFRNLRVRRWQSIILKQRGMLVSRDTNTKTGFKTDE